LATKKTVVVELPLASVMVSGGRKTGLQGSLSAEKTTLIPATPLPLQSLKLAVNVNDPPGSTMVELTVAVAEVAHD
jgi:hypothetical protein